MRAEAMFLVSLYHRLLAGTRFCLRVVIIAWLCGWLCCGLVHAGSMRFESAGTYVSNDTYYLDAFARVDLGMEPVQALINGVELHFLVQLAVFKTRRWWIDTPILERRLRYRLDYYELTQHFRVTDVQSGESENFRSVAAAVRELGSLSRYALLPSNQINKRRQYIASIQLGLDLTRLPGPLMAQALRSDEWQLETEEFQWSLN